MGKDSKFEELQQPEYGVYVRREEDLFTLVIPELGIARRHQDLNEGFKELTVAREKYFKDMADSEEQSSIPKPEMFYGAGTSIPVQGDFNSLYFPFFVKAAICMLLFFGFGGIGLVVVGNTVAKNISWATYIVETKMDDEKVQKVAQRIHQFGEKIKPIVYELKLIWQMEQKSAAELPDEPVNMAGSP